MSDDQTVWSRQTSIERYANEKGIAVIMPDGDLSWYTDCQLGRYFDFLCNELPQKCYTFFPQLSHDKVFIAGNSMGGYGAFKAALTYPDRYKAAASLSGALDIRVLDFISKEYTESIFGEHSKIEGSCNDLFSLSSILQTKTTKDSRPKLFMWCGKDDFLYKTNQLMHNHLESLGYDLIYTEGVGAHNWECWDLHIRDVLNWLPF